MTIVWTPFCAMVSLATLALVAVAMADASLSASSSSMASSSDYAYTPAKRAPMFVILLLLKTSAIEPSGTSVIDSLQSLGGGSAAVASVSTRDLWTFSTVVCLSSTLDMKTMHTHTSKVSSNLTRCFQRARDRLSGTCLQSHCTPHRCAVSPHVNIMTLNNLLIPVTPQLHTTPVTPPRAPTHQTGRTSQAATARGARPFLTSCPRGMRHIR